MSCFPFEVPPFSLSKMAHKPQLPSGSSGPGYLQHSCTHIEIDFEHFLLVCLVLIWLLDQPENLEW